MKPLPNHRILAIVEIVTQEGFYATPDLVTAWITSPPKIGSTRIIDKIDPWVRFQGLITKPNEYGCRFWLGARTASSNGRVNRTGNFNSGDHHNVLAHRYYFEQVNNTELKQSQQLVCNCVDYGAPENNLMCVVHSRLHKLGDGRRLKDKCSIEGCERCAYAKGYCSLHYRRFRLHGDPHKVLPPGGLYRDKRGRYKKNKKQ